MRDPQVVERAWKQEPWQLFGCCSSCGADGKVAGKSRRKVLCLDCYLDKQGIRPVE